jgi:RNA polymerase sigma-70 factor (ECF subfamily)
MAAPVDSLELEPYRAYLRVLAGLQVPRELQGCVDPSDLVQETLLHAHRNRALFRGSTAAERAAWLRQILACRVVDALRRRSRTADTRSLDAALDESTARLADLLVAPHSTPSQKLAREEAALEAARGLAELSEAQAQAIVLRHLENRPVAEIAQLMGRTPEAVGGLLRHGLKTLRGLMSEAHSR